MLKQIIFSAIILSTTLVFASTPSSLSPELKKDYEDFQKDYEAILSLPTDKVKFAQEFKRIETGLQKKYKDFDKKEGKLLSDEGNQMALDIETLVPLRIIAEGKASKESCSNAAFINELNNSSEKEVFEKLKSQIDKLCK